MASRALPRIWLVCTFALVACTKPPGPSPDLGRADLAGTVNDGASGDLSSSGAMDGPTSTVGIACGAMACATMAQYCCSDDKGKTGTCMSEATPSCGLAGDYHCDGPEDCPPAEPECCAQNGTSSCRAAGTCPGLTMCHTTMPASCGVGISCCKDPSGGPFALCVPGNC
jgi:hypothetical protein